jgi:hypothetical protein
VEDKAVLTLTVVHLVDLTTKVVQLVVAVVVVTLTGTGTTAVVVLVATTVVVVKVLGQVAQDMVVAVPQVTFTHLHGVLLQVVEQVFLVKVLTVLTAAMVAVVVAVQADRTVLKASHITHGHVDTFVVETTAVAVEVQALVNMAVATVETVLFVLFGVQDVLTQQRILLM